MVHMVFVMGYASLWQIIFGPGRHPPTFQIFIHSLDLSPFFPLATQDNADTTIPFQYFSPIINPMGVIGLRECEWPKVNL